MISKQPGVADEGARATREAQTVSHSPHTLPVSALVPEVCDLVRIERISYDAAISNVCACHDIPEYRARILRAHFASILSAEVRP